MDIEMLNLGRLENILKAEGYNTVEDLERLLKEDRFFELARIVHANSLIRIALALATYYREECKAYEFVRELYRDE